MHYADALAAYQAVDFDDLIRLPVELLERDAGVARALAASAADHVLVDEYQDTNPAQYRLFRALVGDARALHRGGRRRPGDLRLARRDRSRTSRSSSATTRRWSSSSSSRTTGRPRASCASANALIANNAKLHDKRLWSDSGHGDAIRVVAARDEEPRPRSSRPRSRRTASSTAAAGRTTRCSTAATTSRAPFEAALRAQATPYEVSGGQSWFERAEIKDLVAYLRLIANEDDDPAFLRAVAVPKRGVGQTTLAKLADVAAARRTSLAAVFAPRVRLVGARRARARRSTSSAR